MDNTNRPTDPASKSSQRWHKEADVIVIGFGGAGAVSAITARDAGAEVIILEKMPLGKEGGSTRVSGGIVFSPGDVPSAVDYLQALACGTVEEELIAVLAQGMSENAEYLISLGADPEGKKQRGLMDYPHLPGAAGCGVSYYMPGNGFALFTLLSEQVKKRKIEVLYQTPALELIQNNPGEVVGVIARSEGEKVRLKARRGVILTCGGFLFNPGMQKNFFGAWPFLGFGSPGNTGDGIRLAQKAGADLWHMAQVTGPCLPAFLPLGFSTPFMITLPADGYVFVDQHGRRFMNEKKPALRGKGWQEILYYDGRRTEFPRIPWFIVFDEITRIAGPLAKRSQDFLSGGLKIGMRFSWNAVMEDYEWSSDNRLEIEQGWIQQGKTVPRLAEALNLEPEILEQTLEQYNAGVEAGEDLQFQRPANTFTPIRTPPFYAIEVYPGALSSQGGPRRNARAQIVDPEGKPIPRLYGAGECGSAWGFLYQGSGHLGECLAFGRIAGRNVAAEAAWY